jgi:threonine dehydratase
VGRFILLIDSNEMPVFLLMKNSAGNHAMALAYHGRELGIPATVVMPTVAPMAKVDKCRVSSSTVFIV